MLCLPFPTLTCLQSGRRNRGTRVCAPWGVFVMGQTSLQLSQTELNLKYLGADVVDELHLPVKIQMQV